MYQFITDQSILPTFRRYIGWHYFAPHVKPNMYIILEGRFIIPVVSCIGVYSCTEYIQKQTQRFHAHIHQPTCSICMDENRPFFVQCANDRCTALLCANCSVNSAILGERCPFCQTLFILKEIYDLPMEQMIEPHIIQDKIIHHVQDKHEYNLIFLTEGTFRTMSASDLRENVDNIQDKLGKLQCLIGVYDMERGIYEQFIDSLAIDDPISPERVRILEETYKSFFRRNV